MQPLRAARAFFGGLLGRPAGGRPAGEGLRLALLIGGALVLGGTAPGAARAAPPPQTDDTDQALADTGEPEEAEPAEPAPPEPRWITHVVVPRENLDTIAMRYGVTRDSLVKWNKKKLGTKQWIYAGQKLKVHARLHPPPREKITYVVVSGDTWSKIADRFGVPFNDLRAWNPKVYTDPKAPPPAAVAAKGGKAPLPELHVRAGGYEVGRPNRGHLVNGVQLPESEMVRILDPDKVWGTTHTIQNLLLAIATFRRDSGFDQPLTISSISLRKGGRFGPHSSHRTGRDVDIRLPRKSGAPKGEAPSSIDWTHTWRLVEALVGTGEVEYIFVSWSRQKYLHRAAQSAGASKEQLEKLVQWPRKPNTNKGIVRHADGHTVHLHVRFKCTPGNSRCESY
jgi:LysM repeat protein